jgi:hypothetical protein
MAKKVNKSESKFDFRTIKTFEDACVKLGIEPKLPDVSMILEELQKPTIAAYKLMVIFKAINNGWKPNWSNYDEYKYIPWYEVLSSGFGFSFSYYHFTSTLTSVGSRLCTDSSEKALYIAEQFKQEYQEYFLYSE